MSVSKAERERKTTKYCRQTMQLIFDSSYIFHCTYILTLVSSDHTKLGLVENRLALSQSQPTESVTVWE